MHLFEGYTKDERKKIAEVINIIIQHGGQDLLEGFMGIKTPFYEGAIMNKNDESCSPNENGELVLRPLYPHHYNYTPNATKDA
ncbi:hypothetical protein [Oceanobacillus halophilus]|uniref:Uncharacterized protein n=1 Tax=Oceanobacillus halophilus TaxID=930130 RepID=A0A495A7F8_9BACI|nr:hypothetical protein [Oceanobacillus halophilus]RKQ35730.1 hypothetical protein D8M06_05565 [Oceanobacillus halophilus]